MKNFKLKFVLLNIVPFFETIMFYFFGRLVDLNITFVFCVLVFLMIKTPLYFSCINYWNLSKTIKSFIVTTLFVVVVELLYIFAFYIPDYQLSMKKEDFEGALISLFAIYTQLFLFILSWIVTCVLKLIIGDKR